MFLSPSTQPVSCLAILTNPRLPQAGRVLELCVRVKDMGRGPPDGLYYKQMNWLMYTEVASRCGHLMPSGLTLGFWAQFSNSKSLMSVISSR